MPDADAVTCDLCAATLPAHASYVVRIDVFADPSLPPMSGDELAGFDFDAALEQVAEEAAGMTADDLQDGVHRRFEYRLCPRCQKRFLANPLGKPRDVRPATN
ncbi:MAG: hypothetical protein AVDCRST_MAG64-979 [uncultured Phycisphaerae bacterium]|uniref:Uncharacterized protein n=1 Tax=uncultured Phycisphaerae bacterium TaxID=904963 RepID=A0A6J4NF57_9BACT|nr:MAG: hypothetical protein AVDCRST_MAG64-979 [uncultured Phycisphaerae bacterium]